MSNKGRNLTLDMLKVVLRYAVPIFFAISGFLYAKMDKEKRLDYIEKLFGILVVSSIVCLFLTNKKLYSKMDAEKLFRILFITGVRRHLWYIVALLEALTVNGIEVGMVSQRILTFLPKFEIHKNGQYLGCLNKELSFFVPHYNLDYNGWHIDGSFMEWDYNIVDHSGSYVASVSKELFNFTDTYSIDVVNPQDALDALMFVLAIDAEKCSRN